MIWKKCEYTIDDSKMPAFIEWLPWYTIFLFLVLPQRDNAFFFYIILSIQLRRARERESKHCVAKERKINETIRRVVSSRLFFFVSMCIKLFAEEFWWIAQDSNASLCAQFYLRFRMSFSWVEKTWCKGTPPLSFLSNFFEKSSWNLYTRCLVVFFSDDFDRYNFWCFHPDL